MRLSNTTLRDGTQGVKAVGRPPQTPPRREPRICFVTSDTSEGRRKDRYSIRIPVAFDPLDRTEAVPVRRRRVGLPARQLASRGPLTPHGPPLDHVA